MKPLRRLLQQIESIKVNPTQATRRGISNLRELEAGETEGIRRLWSSINLSSET